MYSVECMCFSAQLLCLVLSANTALLQLFTAGSGSYGSKHKCPQHKEFIAAARIRKVSIDVVCVCITPNLCKHAVCTNSKTFLLKEDMEIQSKKSHSIKL